MVRSTSNHNRRNTSDEPRPRVINTVDLPVDRSEVLRYLGYPAGTLPSGRLRPIVDHWITEAHRRATPRAIYTVFSIDAINKRSLRLNTARGVVEFKGAIGEFLGVSQRIAAFIATAGPNVEALASEMLGQGDALAAAIVNAVGAERAEAAEQVVFERLRGDVAAGGLAPTLPYSPGYCGMAITEQTKLFDVIDGAAIGVALTPSHLMRPLKSVSGLIGLGPPEDIQQYGSPCDRCELTNCDMRRSVS